MRPTRGFLSITVALVLTLGVGAESAAAEDIEKARVAYQEATSLYKLGRFQEALQRFEQAYIAKPDPAFLFNVGQCYRMLGEPEKAIRAYRNFLREMPDAPNREQIEALIAELETQIEPSPPTDTIEPEKGRGAAAGVDDGGAIDESTTVRREGGPERSRPVYKQWWFWTAVGGVALAGLGVGLGVGLAIPRAEPTVLVSLR